MTQCLKISVLFHIWARSLVVELQYHVRYYAKYTILYCKVVSVAFFKGLEPTFLMALYSTVLLRPQAALHQSTHISIPVCEMHTISNDGHGFLENCASMRFVM